jgi:cobalt-zinc-cadmium efflux system outer membrane protein
MAATTGFLESRLTASRSRLSALAQWLGLGLLSLGLVGCSHFQPKPISADHAISAFEARSLDNPNLRPFLETNLHRAFSSWPLETWDFETLSFVAFYYHPDLDLARARWAVVRAGQITAKARPNPTLSFEPQYDTTAGPPWIPLAFVDLPIETAGKRRYRKAQAGHSAEAARWDILSAAWQVRSRVRRSLLDLYTAQETYTLLTQQQTLQEELVKQLEGQLAAGAISPFEVTQARIALNTTRLAVLEANRQGAETKVQLADALGLSVRALQKANLSFADLSTFPQYSPPPEVSRQALTNRADILSALADYAATQAALQLEIAKQYPDIHLGPGYLLDQTDNKWQLAVSATLPIFDQNQGPIAEAEARRTEAAIRFQALQDRVIGEIDHAVAGYCAALQKSAAAESLLADHQKQEKSIQAMLAAGELSRQSLTTAQLERNTSELARLDARVKAQQALSALEDALQSPLKLDDSLLKNPREKQSAMR